MKKILLLSLLLIYSCSSNTPSQPNNNNQVNNNTSQSKDKQTNNFSSNEIAGLKFNKVSDQNVNLINNQQKSQGKSGSVSNSAAPLAPSSDMVSRQGVSAPEMSRIGKPDIYGGYFNSQNPFEEYIMIDYQEAKTKGSNGSFLESYNSIVKPIIKEWTNDYKSTYIYGNINDNNQNNDVNINGFPYTWQYTYVSPSKKEVYSILISSKETLVLRQKWVLKNFIDTNIKIDSVRAIKIFSDKVKDKNYNSEYDNNNLSPNSKPMFEIPDNTYWTFYLSQEKDYLVWNINTNYIYPTIPPIQNGQSYTNTWYSGGFARINAETGEIISMSRPVKYSEVIQNSGTTECNENGCSSSGSIGAPTIGATVD
ncbi:MAG: hypothetical protein U0354_19290 [Candidatus Sericytochromatia bacterium]